MIVVIPYKQEVHGGLELKFALRSIGKYLSGWIDVVVIGEPPKWYNGFRISHSDTPGRKEYSIYSKLLTACKDPYVTQDFLMWNDDHFLLKHLHVSDIKYWHNGILDEDNNGGGRNRLAIQNTKAILNKNGALNYDIHTPIVYNKARFEKLFKEVKAEVSIKSLYANQVEVEPAYMEDCKISQWVEIRKLKELTKDRLFFSTGTSLSTPTIEYLESLYPEPSIFET